MSEDMTIRIRTKLRDGRMAVVMLSSWANLESEFRAPSEMDQMRAIDAMFDAISFPEEEDA